MSVKIRMARHGAKKKPFYRIVAAHSEAPRNGAFLEILGTYDPKAKENAVQFKSERVQYWLGQGAIPSVTVKQLLKKHSTPPTQVS